MAGKVEPKSITTARDLVNFITANNLEDMWVLIGSEGYTSGEDLSVYCNGEYLLVCDTCYYEGFTE